MAKRRTKSRNYKHMPRSTSGIRPFWSGTISFGLVSVPVQLFPGSRPAGVKFRMLDDDGVPLARRYFCPKQNRDIHREHLLRGYEIEEGEYVIVRDEELEAAEPEKTREIDLRWFVGLAEVSPMIFERSYFLTPTGDSNKAYRLLAEVIEESGRAGIATFVMRDREYLIAIIAQNGILRAETLRFADEIRSPDDVGLPDKERVSRADVTRWERLIKKHTDQALNEKLLVDDYAEAVRELAEKKKRGHKDVVHIAVAEKEDELDDDEESVPDLLETIRRSLKQTRSRTTNGNGHQRSREMESTDNLADQSKEELYEEAKKLEIPNRSKLTKRQLVRAIDRIHSQT